MDEKKILWNKRKRIKYYSKNENNYKLMIWVYYKYYTKRYIFVIKELVKIVF